MKKLTKIKLHDLSQAAMAKREQRMLIGGSGIVKRCACVCVCAESICACTDSGSGFTTTTDTFRFNQGLNEGAFCDGDFLYDDVKYEDPK